MQASSFDKISTTALLVAYARQFTDIPDSQELARLVNAQMIVEQILGEQSEPPVEVVVVLEGRYKAINQVMMQRVEVRALRQWRSRLSSDSEDIT